LLLPCQCSPAPVPSSLSLMGEKNREINKEIVHGMKKKKMRGLKSQPARKKKEKKKKKKKKKRKEKQK
jgi:capsid protein